MSKPVDLSTVEKHLASELKALPVDEREKSLLGRECADIPLLPEASAAIGGVIAGVLLTELSRVLGDLREAYESQPREGVPDWVQDAAHACAFVALRRAWVATHHCFLAAKKEGD
jgi:hypothetical protein